MKEFVWDYHNRLVKVTDKDNSGNGSQSVLSERYLHGVGVDQVLAQEDGDGNVIWMLTDHLGTVRDLSDDNGTLANHIIYHSFGRVISGSDASIDTRYLFTGREFDEEIELYYYRARYHDAEVGRFK